MYFIETMLFTLYGRHMDSHSQKDKETGVVRTAAFL